MDWLNSDVVNSLTQAAVGVGKALARFVVVGVVASAIAFGVVQAIKGKKGEKACEKCGVIPGSERIEKYCRMLALVLGMGFAMVWHGATPPQGVLNFGAGPSGWWMAAAAGIAGGAFAPKVHDWSKKLPFFNKS